MNNKYKNAIWLMVVMLLGVSGGELFAAPDRPMTEEELEKWFYSDEEPVDPLKLINEGELVFLKQEPERNPHQAHHKITILPSSLKQGWVRLYQCHENLDVMPAAQVVFLNKRVRNLKLVSSANIKKAWVEGDTVQMSGIEKDASLCLEVETKAFWKNEDGSYSLRTGPYQRKFLDGYFPMRLLLDIKLPENKLVFKGTIPATQPGLSVVHDGSSVNMNALFEGQLHIIVHFRIKGAGDE